MVTKLSAVTAAFLALLCAFPAGCATAPSAEELSNADYGDRPDSTVVDAAIRSFWSPRLIDPTAPLYSFSEPYRSYSKRLPRRVYGWAVDYTINSKNRLGGYTGPRQAQAFFRDGQLVMMSYVNELGGWEHVTLAL